MDSATAIGFTRPRGAGLVGAQTTHGFIGATRILLTRIPSRGAGYLLLGGNGRACRTLCPVDR